MREIESIRARKGGEPTFRSRRLTISHMLHGLAQGGSIKDFAEDYEIDPQHIKNALRDIADNIRSWMRPKQLYELWIDYSDPDGDDVTFTLAENVGDLMSRGLISSNAELEYSVMAESTNEAYAEYNKRMGWEEHRPMLNCNDEPYSEDEGDTVTTDDECKDCGNTLDSCGYCIDLDCPYSECLQHEEPVE